MVRVCPRFFRHQRLTCWTEPGISNPTFQRLSGHAEEQSFAGYRVWPSPTSPRNRGDAMLAYVIKGT
jgi:hypothetical protein